MGADQVNKYNSPRWKKKREHILRRDGWIDQVMIRDGVKIEADTVHHILPREQYPEYEWEDWNLISVNRMTHTKRIHNVWNGDLTRLGKTLMIETAQANGVPLQMTTLVVGLPGTGKTTYAKRNLHGGLAYDLDMIASAFRLAVPGKEPQHAGARRMAAALRSGWIQAAKQYSNNLIVIRTAPDEAELAETQPDRIVVCTKQFVDRKINADREALQSQLENVISWAEANDVPVEWHPPRG